MRRKVWGGVVLAGWLGLSGMVRAEEAPAEPSLGTIVVTATRSEQRIEQATTSISVITADDIQSRNADVVTDVLRDVPGVDVAQQGSKGNTASVYLRGAESAQTLILVDGVEVNSPTLGGFNFGTLNTDNLDRIEVLRGAGGTLYGSGAMGGVVNILTKRGRGPLRVTLLEEGGSGDAQRHQVGVAGSQGGVGVSGSVSYQSLGGFRPVNDDYSNLAASLRADADVVEGGTLRGFFRYHDASVGLFNNLAYLGMPDPNARFREERYLLKGEWEHRPIDNLTYIVAGSVVHDSQVFDDPDGTFSVHNRIPTQIGTAEARASYAEGEFGLTTAGFEFKRKEARPKSLDVRYDSETWEREGLEDHRQNLSREGYSGYVQQQVLLLDERFVGAGGFRVDSDEHFGEEVSASWSVGYLQDWDGSGRWSTRVRGGYAEGFRAPTFNDLFFPDYGNPDAKPEISSEYDGGVAQRVWGERFTVDATYFNRRTHRLIQAVCALSGVDFLCQAENIGRADVQGAETGVTLQPLRELTVRGGYTYVDWRVVGASGPPTLLRRPHHHMTTTVRYRRDDVFHPGHAVDIVGRVNFVGDSADYSATIENHTVADAAVTYSLPSPCPAAQRVAMFTRVNNLADESYEEVAGYRAPRVNFTVGTRVTF